MPPPYPKSTITPTKPTIRPKPRATTTKIEPTKPTIRPRPRATASTIEQPKPGKSTLRKGPKVSEINIVTLNGPKVGKVGYLTKAEIRQVEQRMSRLDNMANKQLPDKKLMAQREKRITDMMEKQLKKL